MPRLSVWMLRAALLHFGLGVSAGALMLWNKGVPLDARLWLLLNTHVEMLLVGWLLQVALGTAFWILPRLGERRYGDVRLGWAACLLLNTSVVLVAFSAPLNLTGFLLPGRLMQILAVALMARLLWPRVKAFAT